MPPGKRGPGRKEPRWSAERRAGQRHWPVDLRPNSRRSARPRGGPRVRRSAPSACRRSAPLNVRGDDKERKGEARRPKIKATGPRSVGYMTSEDRNSKMEARCFTLPCRGRVDAPKGRRGGVLSASPDLAERRTRPGLAALAHPPPAGEGEERRAQQGFTGPGKRALVGAGQTRCRGGSSGGLDVQRTKNRGGQRCL